MGNSVMRGPVTYNVGKRCGMVKGTSTVRATPSNIPKQALCGLYKNSGLGEMRLME